jgi:predicted small metal-binding protein
MKRWACLEAGCSAIVTAADEDELIEKTNAHMGEAHDSYELEDVILAGTEDVDDDGG